MKKLLKSKKGFNDMVILTTIVGFFFLSALLINNVGSGFGISQTAFNPDIPAGEVNQEAEGVSTFNAFQIMITVLKLGFWDFGNSLNLHWSLDAIYTLMSIVLIFTVARNLWVGGGG